MSGVCESGSLYCQLLANRGRRCCHIHALLDPLGSASLVRCSVAGCWLPARKCVRPICKWHRSQALSGPGANEEPSTRSQHCQQYTDWQYIRTGCEMTLAQSVFSQSPCVNVSGSCTGGNTHSQTNPTQRPGSPHRCDQSLDDAIAMEHCSMISAEDGLRPTGSLQVLTDEEVLRQTINSLQQLRQAYIDQMHAIKQRVKSSYLRSLRRVKGILPPGSSADSIGKEKRFHLLYLLSRQYGGSAGAGRLLAFKRRCARGGVSHDFKRRLCSAADDDSSGGSGVVACLKPALPLTRYCLQHVLQQNNQVLYSECSAAPGKHCPSPVIDVPNCSRKCQRHWHSVSNPNSLPARSDPVSAPEGAAFRLEDSLNDSQCEFITEIANTLLALASGDGIGEINSTVTEQLAPTVTEQLAPTVTEQLDATVTEQLDATVTEQLDATVTEQLGATVTEQLDATVTEQLDATVTEQLDATVTEQLDATVTEQLDATVTEQLTSTATDQLTSTVTDQLTSTVTEQLDATVTEQLDATVTEQLDATVTEQLAPSNTTMEVD